MADDIYQIIGLTLLFIIVFFIIRGYIKAAVNSNLSKKYRKKRKQNQKFTEWLCYRHYNDVIPKALLVWYYANFIIYFSMCVLIVVDSWYDGFKLITENVVLPYMIVSAIPMIIARIWLAKKDK